MANDHHHHHKFDIHKLAVFFYFSGLALFLIGLLPFINATLFNFPLWLIISLNVGALLLAGHHVVVEGLIETIKNTIKYRRFKPNIHILMTLGAIGAIIIGDYTDAALLILIFAGAHFLEDYAEAKSKKEITNLLKITPQNARLLQRDGQTIIVPVTSLKIGDYVVVLNGDQVPTDGIITSGSASINEAMITGESIPVEKHIGADVFGGSINGNSTFTMEVTKDSSDTVIAKIIRVVSETKTNISQTATFIKKFEPIYVTAVIIVAPLFYLLGNFGLNWGHELALHRMIILFIGASPCALAVSDIPATLSALSLLAKRGVILKGGAPLSLFASTKAIAFDKTGTLTYGHPEVIDVIYDPALTVVEQNEINAIIVSMETKANHPLANALLRHFHAVNAFALDVINEIGKGVRTTYNGNDYLIGKPNLFNVSDEVNALGASLANEGKTVIMFSTNGIVQVVFGLIDLAKDSARTGLTYFNDQNIATVMITGDNALTAQALGSNLHINKIYANVLPVEKQKIISELKDEFTYVTMVGDGINDAPALVEATVGVAMGDGTEVAIDAADAVLVNNDFDKLVLTHKVSLKLRHIVLQNIVFAMIVVFVLIFTNFFVTLPMAAAVTIHEGSTILVILNGLRLLNFRQK